VAVSQVKVCSKPLMNPTADDNLNTTIDWTTRSMTTNNNVAMQTGQALDDFYTSLDGEHWFVNLGWLDDSDCCMWFGITCNANGSVTDMYDPMLVTRYRCIKVAVEVTIEWHASQQVGEQQSVRFYTIVDQQLEQSQHPVCVRRCQHITLQLEALIADCFGLASQYCRIQWYHKPSGYNRITAATGHSGL
jgi:hypothetical protein